MVQADLTHCSDVHVDPAVHDALGKLVIAVGYGQM